MSTHTYLGTVLLQIKKSCLFATERVKIQTLIGLLTHSCITIDNVSCNSFNDKPAPFPFRGAARVKSRV